jgi:hypothetical protein
MLPGSGKAWHFEHSRLAKRSGLSALGVPAATRHKAKPNNLRGGVIALGQACDNIGGEQTVARCPKTSKKTESGFQLNAEHTEAQMVEVT